MMKIYFGGVRVLYSRDYNLGLTEQEKEQYKVVAGREFGEKRTSGFGRANNPAKYPKAARLCQTLFPNNFLDFIDLRDGDNIVNKNRQFLEFLNTCKNEREILNYIRETESYHIIGSLLRGMALRIGHHGAFLFPEFQLSNKYQVDYLLVGKSSGGYEFVLVELENPYGNIMLKDGNLGAEFRDGISQIDEWKRWLQNNYTSFSETLKKYKNIGFDLPDEFYTLDLSRFHYVVIAGRRNDFTELTYTITREKKKKEDITLLHYDNLYDFSNLLIDKVTY